MARATPSPEQLRALAQRVRDAAGPLHALPAEARANAIARAANVLLDARSALGAALRVALAQTSGLTPAVIEHGLQTTLGLFERDALLELLAGAQPARVQLTAVVLAGNVFSAAARPLLLPLLCGSSVLAKAASGDDALPRALADALAAVDEVIGAACAVVTFAREHPALLGALLADADSVHAYGSDATIAALTPQLPPRAQLFAHGHGLGAIAISREALASESAARVLAQRAARDIAAYDQRGCLSPHFALIESGAAVDARGFAKLLAAELAELERSWPRGPLPQDAAAAQLQWRGVAAAVGELHHGGTWAVSHEPALPPRASPGHRNLAIHACAELATARAQLLAFGSQLKALALAGARAHAALTGLAPYCCELGAMQTPPLDARLDGLHPLALTRL